MRMRVAVAALEVGQLQAAIVARPKRQRTCKRVCVLRNLYKFNFTKMNKRNSYADPTTTTATTTTAERAGHKGNTTTTR